MKFAEWLVQFGFKFDQYTDRLVQTGVDTAQQIFAQGGEDYGGSVDVNSERLDRGSYTITASGDAAPFMEFGAGVETAVTRPTVEASYPIYVGSYSDENGGQFSKTGYQYWHYQKKKYTGLVPLGGMQEACNVMEQQSPDIARKVFG